MTLIKPGVWHSTVWASGTWQEDLWLEYGAASVVGGDSARYYYGQKTTRKTSYELFMLLQKLLKSV